MVHIRWADAPSQRDRGPQDAPPIGEGSSALAVANAQRVVQRVSTELSLSLSDKRHSLDACFRLFGSRAGMTQPLMLSCSSMTKRNETKRNEQLYCASVHCACMCGTTPSPTAVRLGAGAGLDSGHFG